MQVLVTGGSGQIGQELISDLLTHGHSAVAADLRRPSTRSSDYRFIETDVSDVGQVAGAMKGCDAVVHLGAIPTAYQNPDEVVFRHNVGATFAVFQAASLLNVRKAAFASSLAVIGMPYAREPAFPLFAPIDETHPLLVQDPYGLSKEVDERTGEMFHRRTGMQVAAMRFALVSNHADLKALCQRLTENPSPSFLDRVLWSYVDVRDAASILRLAIEADSIGFQAFVVAAKDALVDHPTEELIRRYAPAVEIRMPIEGNRSAVSTAKANELLGWEPHHSWRDAS